MGMGWKRFKEDYKKEIARMEAKDEAKKQAKAEKRQQQMELNPPKTPMTEQERLAKRGNILITGFSIWFLIPFITVVLIVGLVAVVGVYDWFINLF
jgi:Flp pilus assembly protein TadB